MSAKKVDAEQLAIRDNFYSWCLSEFGYKKFTVQTILKGKGYHAFSVTKIDEYKEVIQEHYHNALIREMVRRRKEILKHLEKDETPCPIPDCPGVIVHPLHNLPICSIGGFHHAAVLTLQEIPNFNLSQYLLAYRRLINDENGQGSEES